MCHDDKVKSDQGTIVLSSELKTYELGIRHWNNLLKNQDLRKKI